MRKLRHFSKFLPAVLLCLALTGCAAPSILRGRGISAEPISRTGFYFDTVITISLYGLTEGTANDLLDDCMALAQRYDEELFSAHSSRSQIWALNHAGEQQAAGGEGEEPPAVTVDAEVAELLKTALIWRAKTDGAFSPTLGALTELWNFGGDPPGPVPRADSIAEALQHIDPASLQLDWPSSSAAARITIDDPALRIDPGGIAKGYIADQLKAYLVAHGAKSAVINLGGNVLLVGAKPDGSNFAVGIQDPGTGGEATPGALLLTVEASDISVVTSGTYERYFEEGGVRYHHILDPATGYPADSGLVSVTIVSPDSTTGDALATACLVMGQEKGQTLVESLPDVEALFVTKGGAMLFTDGFPR